jgi:hypothetical protein
MNTRRKNEEDARSGRAEAQTRQDDKVVVPYGSHLAIPGTITAISAGTRLQTQWKVNIPILMDAKAPGTLYSEESIVPDTGQETVSFGEKSPVTVVRDPDVFGVFTKLQELRPENDRQLVHGGSLPAPMVSQLREIYIAFLSDKGVPIPPDFLPASVTDEEKTGKKKRVKKSRGK